MRPWRKLKSYRERSYDLNPYPSNNSLKISKNEEKAKIFYLIILYSFISWSIILFRIKYVSEKYHFLSNCFSIFWNLFVVIIVCKVMLYVRSISIYFYLLTSFLRLFLSLFCFIGLGLSRIFSNFLSAELIFLILDSSVLILSLCFDVFVSISTYFVCFLVTLFIEFYFLVWDKEWVFFAPFLVSFSIGVLTLFLY